MASALTSEQNKDREFLVRLADALSDKKFAGQNFANFGTLYDGNRYSIMVDNYQIEVARTGVWHYPNWRKKLMGTPVYRFEPGKFERYEVYVSENLYPMHLEESNELLHGAHEVEPGRYRQNYNMLLMVAAMARGDTFFYAPVFDSRPASMFFQQNAHLFADAKRLYEIFDARKSDAVSSLVVNKTVQNTDLSQGRAAVFDKICDSFARQK